MEDHGGESTGLFSFLLMLCPPFSSSVVLGSAMTCNHQVCCLFALCSYLNIFERKDLEIERKFFQSNHSVGEFYNLVVVGCEISPPNEVMKCELIKVCSYCCLFVVVIVMHAVISEFLVHE